MQRSELQVRHDPVAHRFTTSVDGHQAYVEYAAGDGVIALTHTVVPDAIGGRGIAGQLVQTSLEYARAQGLKVLPRCSYAVAYMDKHPQYADLRTD